MEQAILIALVLLCSGVQAGELVRMKNETLSLPSTSTQQKMNSKQINTGVLGSMILGPRFSATLDRVYYIVQFDGPVRDEWKKPLIKSGIVLGSYLPDDAYLAKIETHKGWQALNSNEHVRAVSVYKTELRLSREFQTSDSKKAIEAVVRLTSENEISNFLISAKTKNISFVLESGSGATLQIAALKVNIEKLADIEGVEWIEPSKPMGTFDFEVSANENPPAPEPNGNYTDLDGYESGTKLMNFEGAYSRGLHGEEEVVGIADTGLDLGSTTDILDDLKGQILKGYALGFFSKSWSDPQGHGTHTSGSIVSTGISSHEIIRGGAYKSKLIMQGLWSPMLNNLSIIPNFDKLFGRLRREDNVKIHSDSWGSPASLGNYDNFASMVDDVAWKNPDLLIIFAAGNSGKDGDKDGHIDEGSVSSPGTAKNCLTVGASKNLVAHGGIQKMMKELRNGTDSWGVEPIASSRLSDTPNGMAAFSSIGPTLDGRLKPEIVAPGTNILSTRDQTKDSSPLWGAYNQVYAYAGGTSMATPLTAGAAAVVRQYLRTIGFENPSAALLKATLIHGATDLFPGQFGLGQGQEFKTTRPNVNEGYGRVNVDTSTTILKNRLIDETVGLKTTESKSYGITAQPGQSVRATMVYTDAPASAGAAQALVNDLDLKIVDEAGKTYFPNHLNGPDEANNTEMVEFVATTGGNFSVVVTGRNVPKGVEGTGAQPYALVLP